MGRARDANSEKLRPKRFFVYVIKLAPEVVNSKRFRAANSNYKDGAECFYVGMTARTPQERFDQHRNGYKACRFVTRYGLELMSARDYGVCNPRTYEEARRLDRKKARILRQQGCGVWQK